MHWSFPQVFSTRLRQLSGMPWSLPRLLFPQPLGRGGDPRQLAGEDVCENFEIISTLSLFGQCLESFFIFFFFVYWFVYVFVGVFDGVCGVRLCVFVCHVLVCNSQKHHWRHLFPNQTG